MAYTNLEGREGLLEALAESGHPLARVGLRLLGAKAIGLYSMPKNLCLQIVGTINPSGGSASIFVVLAFGLFTSWGGTPSALAALLAGTVSWCAGAYWWEISHPYLVSLGTATLAYLSMLRLPLMSPSTG